MEYQQHILEDADTSQTITLPLDFRVMGFYYVYIGKTKLTITLRPHQETALNAMLKHDKGQVIIPTGGGKTLCMIEDTKIHFKLFENQVHVIVAPRILLAEQLCSEFLEQTDAHVMHVHSGETEHFSTKKQILFGYGLRMLVVINSSLRLITLFVVLKNLVLK